MKTVRLLACALVLSMPLGGCGGGSDSDAAVDAPGAADADADTGTTDASEGGATCLPMGAQTPDCTSASNFLCCSHTIGASGATPGVCHCG